MRMLVLFLGCISLTSFTFSQVPASVPPPPLKLLHLKPKHASLVTTSSEELEWQGNLEEAGEKFTTSIHSGVDVVRYRESNQTITGTLTLVDPNIPIKCSLGFTDGKLHSSERFHHKNGSITLGNGWLYGEYEIKNIKVGPPPPPFTYSGFEERIGRLFRISSLIETRPPLLAWLADRSSYYFDGKTDGLQSTHAHNGSKIAEGNYSNGTMNGLWEFWDESGHLVEAGTYANGVKSGLWRMWSADGEKLEEGEFEDGKRNGPWTEVFDKDGKAEGKGVYINGFKSGLWVYHFVGSELLKEEINYTEGYRDGFYRKWNAGNSKPTLGMEGNYTKGRKVGFWVGYYQNGQRLSEENYIKGKVQGMSYEWYENGQKKIESNHKDGSRDGLWTYWYENGQKQAEGNYTKGSKYHGLWTRWYENGQKRDEGIYDNGKKSGLWTDWLENGHKRIEAHYIDGELTNRSFWYENGQKESQSFYGDGIISTSWYENGHKKSEGKSVDYDGSRWFRPFGLWTYWHESGQKKSEGNYTTGTRRSGLWTHWHENGQKKEEGNYTNGKRNGVWKSYNYIGPNASISTHVETIWENGIAYDGLHRSWHENGTLKEEGNYTKGQKHGNWETWGSDGKKLVQEKWNSGKLSSSFVALEDTNNSGILTEWHYSKRKRAEGNFTDGVKSGYWKTWSIYGRQLKGGRYLDGLRVGFWEDAWGENLREISYLDQNITHERDSWQEFLVQVFEGVVHGTVTYWSFENRKEREDNFRMGILLHTKQWVEGQLSRETFFNKLGDGSMERAVSYYPNGQKASESQYNLGVKVSFTSWYENGQKQMEGNKSKGSMQHGLWTYWYENGQKKEESNWREGNKDGLATEWYENGQKKNQVLMRNNDVVNGNVWLPDGETCSVSDLKNGTGVLIFYDNDGTEVSRRKYKDGKREELETQWHDNGRTPPRLPEWLKNRMKKSEGEHTQ